MAMSWVPIGRNVSHLQDLDGVSTTTASETNLFTGGMVHTNGYIDIGELSGCTVNVVIAETGGAAGGTFKYYGAMLLDGTYPYSAASDTAASASTTYQFTISNCPRYIRFTITRAAGVNITVKFKISGYKTGGNL
jgi:hypothetical protein